MPPQKPTDPYAAIADDPYASIASDPYASIANGGTPPPVKTPPKDSFGKRVGKFVNNVAETFNEDMGIPRDVQHDPKLAAQGVKMAVMHPSLEYESLKNMYMGMDAQQQELIDRAYGLQHMSGIGNKASGFALGMWSAVPIAGPMVVNSLDKFASGDVSGALGDWLALGGQLLAGKEGKGVPKMMEGHTMLPAPILPERMQPIASHVKTAIADRLPNAPHPVESARVVMQDAMDAGPSKLREFGKKVQDTRAKVADVNAKRTQAAYDANTKTFDNAKAEQLQAQQEYANEVQRINQENADLKARGEQRAQLEQQLQTASQELEQKIANAKTNAKAANDAQWDAVRAKTAGVTTDIGPLSNAVEQASQIADPNTSALFRSITNAAETEPRPVIVGGQEVPPSNPNYAKFYEVQYGEPPTLGSQAPVTFDTLQRWYNYLGNRMYGTNAWMDAGKWQAFNIVRNALDERMQAIADKSGATPDLAAARESHTNMMETFHDAPTTDRSVASKVLSEANPDYVKAQASADRMAKLGRYDASIADHVQSIQDMRNQIAGLPDADAVTKGMQELPQQPTEIPTGTVKQPNLKAEPQANVAKWRQNQIEGWLASRKSLSPIQVTGLAVGLASIPITLLVPGWHQITGYLGGGLAGAVALKQIFLNAVDKPKVVEWLSKPSAKDLTALKQLPPEYLNDVRTNVQAIVDAGKEKGKTVKVSPSLTSVIGPVTVGALSASEQRRNAAQQKKDLADIRKKYEQQPTSNPNMPYAER